MRIGLFCVTWPEQALRANIYCQISLALNRIYTEWYPSRGYPFNITNSTSYDQYYVHGRTVFDVMVKLTDEIFSTYIRKTGTVNPYYAEYCDGKTVSCPGLKQWGTVTLAQQGRSALSILKYYYGDDIELVSTSNIASIPESYPGSPVRQRDQGASVFTLQRQLNRITQDYPFFGKLTPDGVFGPEMAATVKRFQKQFSLTADGVVGRSTWYRISYIYVSVKDLAELTSEGETSAGDLSDGTWAGVTLRTGQPGRRRGTAAILAVHHRPVYRLHPFGDGGRQLWQRHRCRRKGVPAAFRPDGRRHLRRSHLERGLQPVPQHPGGQRHPQRLPRYALCARATRDRTFVWCSFWLKMARTVLYRPEQPRRGRFLWGTAPAGRSAPSSVILPLTDDGVVGRSTWNKLREVYTAIANDLLSENQRPGRVPRHPPQREQRPGRAGAAILPLSDAHLYQ